MPWLRPEEAALEIPVIYPAQLLTGTLPLAAHQSIGGVGGYMELHFLIRPRLSTFMGSNGLRYLHVLEKRWEWAIRFHSDDHERAGQLSAYAFNAGGGMGAGVRWNRPLPMDELTEVSVFYDHPNFISMKVNGEWATSGERTFMYQNTPITPTTSQSLVRVHPDFVGDIVNLTFKDAP